MMESGQRRSLTRHVLPVGDRLSMASVTLCRVKKGQIAIRTGSGTSTLSALRQNQTSLQGKW